MPQVVDSSIPSIILNGPIGEYTIGTTSPSKCYYTHLGLTQYYSAPITVEHTCVLHNRVCLLQDVGVCYIIGDVF